MFIFKWDIDQGEFIKIPIEKVCPKKYKVNIGLYFSGRVSNNSYYVDKDECCTSIEEAIRNKCNSLLTSIGRHEGHLKKLRKQRKIFLDSLKEFPDKKFAYEIVNVMIPFPKCTCMTKTQDPKYHDKNCPIYKKEQG
jgi:hypothetical protein